MALDVAALDAPMALDATMALDAAKQHHHDAKHFAGNRCKMIMTGTLTT
jgi:hypothetical protein